MTKTNKKSNILIAVSEIVKEKGVAKLTLEAVAKRAGISKGGLLYHYPSKDALIQGMVKEWTTTYFESIATLANNDSQEKGKWIRAYVNIAFSDLDDNNHKHLSAALTAALFINPDLLDEFNEKNEELHAKLLSDGIDSHKMTMVRLMIDGLWFSEMYGISPLSEDMKTQISSELLNLMQEEE